MKQEKIDTKPIETKWCCSEMWMFTKIQYCPFDWEPCRGTGFYADFILGQNQFH
jgi:hypothetical protein